MRFRIRRYSIFFVLGSHRDHMTGACADGYAVQIASGRLLVQEHVPGLAVERSADLASALASLYTARSARDDLLRGLAFGLACAAEDT